MLTIPLLDRLARAERVLIAGVGGGFDIFSGLPLYFALRNAGKAAFLANLSFSFLPPIGEPRLAPAMPRVTADTLLLMPYFPERHLAAWFRTQGEEVAIWCFERTGVQPLLASYRALVDHLDIDTLVLVDGGTDSLMRGDEAGLGTPHEDTSSIVAAAELDVDQKLLVCLGFGVDSYHGVFHADFLEAVAFFTQHGGYLGLVTLLEEMPAVQRYRTATEAVCAMMPGEESIVCTSILTAIAGHYGNYHAISRTHGSTLWINPLMPIYWGFELDGVAARLLYRDALRDTETYEDVQQIIGAYRQVAALKRIIKPPTTIPA